MKNGFTLVELLAVIVILAVLALIATPVVLSIIDDTKESAMLRSAEMYLSGVENAVMRENMNTGGNFRPNECTITNEGNLDCEGKDGIIEVEVNGEKPKNGNIVFENGKIKEVELTYQSGTIIKDESGNLVYEGSGSNITYESLGNWEHKLSDGTIEAHDTESGTCSKCGETVLAPGLYDENGVMTMSWEELLDGEYLFVNNGQLVADTDYSGNSTGTALNILVGKLVIPDSVTSIGENGFIFCNSLTSVIIPDSVTSIGDCAFYRTGLTSVTIPNSVTKMGIQVFQECENLTSVVLEDGLTTLGNTIFYECTSLTSIVIPYGITEISDAFNGCKNLTSITIPDSVTNIDNCAFSGCGMTSITIPSSVTNIGILVFYNCKNLTEINYKGTKTEWNAIELYDEDGCDWNDGCNQITVHCTDGDIIIPANNS